MNERRDSYDVDGKIESLRYVQDCYRVEDDNERSKRCSF